MARYQPLSASAQTAYAQLLDAVHGAELTRSVANLAGTFARKQVKGKTYWYFQYTKVSGRKRQLYVGPRSEEHTSELQSLMRISYAVFCLKKKKTTKDKT